MPSTSRHTSTPRLLPTTALVLLAALLSLPGRGAAEETAVEALTFRGDLNLDGKVSVVDVALLSRWLFQGSPVPVLAPIADMDQDGTVGPTDLTLLVGVLNGTWADQWLLVTTGVPNVDVNALVQSVLYASLLDAEEDLRYYADKVKLKNELKKKIRTEVQAIREYADALRPVDQQEDPMAVLLVVLQAQSEDKEYALRRLGQHDIAEAINEYLRELDTDGIRVTIAVVEDDDSDGDDSDDDTGAQAR